MDDRTHSRGTLYRDAPRDAADRRELPPLSNDERAFWRRAVAIERVRQGHVRQGHVRQGHVRPVPFPFQDR